MKKICRELAAGRVSASSIDLRKLQPDPSVQDPDPEDCRRETVSSPSAHGAEGTPAGGRETWVPAPRWKKFLLLGSVSSLSWVLYSVPWLPPGRSFPGGQGPPFSFGNKSSCSGRYRQRISSEGTQNCHSVSVGNFYGIFIGSTCLNICRVLDVCWASRQACWTQGRT